MNTKKLKKLAEGLLTVPQNQFDITSYVDIIDVVAFKSLHPQHYETLEDVLGEDDIDIMDLGGENLNSDFQIQHNCGTSGCALGWAPTLVEPGKVDETFYSYCIRVFDILPKSPEWYFMFSPLWSGVQNTPEATSKRIMYVVENGTNSLININNHNKIAEGLL